MLRPRPHVAATAARGPLVLGQRGSDRRRRRGGMHCRVRLDDGRLPPCRPQVAVDLHGAGAVQGAGELIYLTSDHPEDENSFDNPDRVRPQPPGAAEVAPPAAWRARQCSLRWRSASPPLHCLAGAPARRQGAGAVVQLRAASAALECQHFVGALWHIAQRRRRCRRRGGLGLHRCRPAGVEAATLTLQHLIS